MSMQEDIILKSLYEKVPAEAVPLCYGLWKEHPFTFKITKDRNSKLGDYRFDPGSKHHTISVNEGLNKFSFLVTYLHEVAHLRVRNRFKGLVSAHGKEWKREFGNLLINALKEEAFPDNLVKDIAMYAKNPKASTAASPTLYQSLRLYDRDKKFFLSEVNEQEDFIFRGVTYQKLSKRRTRSLCLNRKNNKRYLISENAEIEKVSSTPGAS